MEPKCIIAPSLLNADFARLAEVAQGIVRDGADWLHMDVMDGHFVPNLTIGAPIIASLRKHTDAFLDCHLMVSEPEKWVDDFRNAGANQYTFHIEATNDPVSLINKIKAANMKVGISIKPKTPVDAILPYLDSIDTVLVMTVEPGFGGQSFMVDMMPKVEQLRKLRPSLNIEADGGIGPDTIHHVAKAGANAIVSGSAIFKQPEKAKEVISILREAVIKAQEERKAK